jgi:hypothetical protein
MIIPSSSASFGAENRVHFSARCARASDPKVDSTFGIDPMLTSLSGASFFAET